MKESIDLKPYPKMKYSGVPSLGDVPGHWSVRRLKHAFRRIVGGSTPASTNRAYWDGNIVWVTPADVSRAVRLRTSLRQITHDGLTSCSSELVPAGSIIVTSRAPVGNVAVAETSLCTNQGCKALVTTAEVVNPLFGFHVLMTLKGELQNLATGTTFDEISTSRLGSVPMPLPPLDGQVAIVRILEYMDRRILRYIRAKQKLIKLLEEQKQAIIHRAVTRGLHRDVRLRPSGVEWLGNVPEHWRVQRCRYLFHEVDRRSSEGSEEHLSMSQRLGLVPSHLVKNRTLVSESYAGGKVCEIGDLVLNRLKAHLGVFALAKHSGVVSPDYTVLRSRGKEESEAEYFEQVLRSPGCRTELRVRAKGIVEGFWRLYTDDFYDIRLPVPPREERTAIINYTRKATSQITYSMAIAERELALLREYRTRLIADVVTGKVDVREASAWLPNEADEPQTFDETDAEFTQDEDAIDDMDQTMEPIEA